MGVTGNGAIMLTATVSVDGGSTTLRCRHRWRQAEMRCSIDEVGKWEMSPNHLHVASRLGEGETQPTIQVAAGRHRLHLVIMDRTIDHV